MITINIKTVKKKKRISERRSAVGYKWVTLMDGVIFEFNDII